MESLTDDELRLARKSCGAADALAQQVRWSRVAAIAICVAAAMIAGPATWQLAAGGGFGDFGKTVGFVCVLVCFVFANWQFARYRLVAESALSKLYGSIHCHGCGRRLPVNHCPACGKQMAPDGPVASD
jgi:hypothetical protein